MKVHFIAIGGSVMHNLALAMHLKGDQVSGSDDEIFEPALGRLKNHGILPDKDGWDSDRITQDLDLVILGMHARENNPELMKARELGLAIYSFPEYLYEHAKNKKRIVIGGSHGKTTITAMLMHVLKDMGMAFDYMVGAQLEGFEIMVRLSDEAPIMLFEGDEYLSSALDRRPKFHLYRPHVGLISGIEWDHMNVFPTRENYIEQFNIFTELFENDGTLIFCEEDELVCEVAGQADKKLNKIPYGIPEHVYNNGKLSLVLGDELLEIKVFGQHNLMNLNAARLLSLQLGISDKDFYRSIAGFSGAAKRLELLGENETVSVFKDFAHAPSKLRATVEAVKSRNLERELIAVMELHTYSSLNKNFLPNYKDTMALADKAVVMYNPHAFKIKKLPFLDQADVKEGFNRKDLFIVNTKDELLSLIEKEHWQNKNLLLMSSGNFDGADLLKLTQFVLEQ
jgi:UDP-N-acetylmuramate: L-alanyl-gamma-D-glutamyl-meso-diaminopimelate ligase